MVYQFLKDLQCFFTVKGSLTPEEDSLSQRAGAILGTMLKERDTEHLSKNEMIVRLCPETEHPVLAYYDGDERCLCLHNRTIEEDKHDVEQWINNQYQKHQGADANDIMKDVLSGGANSDRFGEMVINEIATDTDSFHHISFQLIRAYRENDCDGILMALCGWSMKSLLEKYRQQTNFEDE